MKLDIESIRRQYEDMEDEALLEIDRDDLVEQARQVYDQEVARRQLRPEASPAIAALDPEELSVVATYHGQDEARAARELLRKAGLRAYLGNEFPEEKSRTLRTAFGATPLLVPLSALEQARGILEAQDEGEAETAGKSIDVGHVRHGVGAVRAYLYGGLDLLEFVQEVFGGLELERHEFSPTALHVEIMIGDSVIALEVSDPPHATATPGSIYVYVADVDDVYARALESGATSVAKPADKPYEERSAGVKDTFGNTWWLSTYTGS